MRYTKPDACVLECPSPKCCFGGSCEPGPWGVKFRRQHPIGAYVADFYCAERRLIVEIDGIAHDMGDKPTQDAGQNEWMRSCGMEVIRIPALDVLRDPERVASSLARLCAAPPPPSGAAHLPPPPAGEDPA